MFGHFRMETDEGDIFNADIPAFSLDSPAAVRTLN